LKLMFVTFPLEIVNETGCACSDVPVQTPS